MNVVCEIGQIKIEIFQVAFWASPQSIKHVKTYADIALPDDGAWEVGMDYLKEDRVRNMRQVGKSLNKNQFGSVNLKQNNN